MSYYELPGWKYLGAGIASNSSLPTQYLAHNTSSVNVRWTGAWTDNNYIILFNFHVDIYAINIGPLKKFSKVGTRMMLTDLKKQHSGTFYHLALFQMCKIQIVHSQKKKKRWFKFLLIILGMKKLDIFINTIIVTTFQVRKNQLATKSIITQKYATISNIT